jgi:hypothetical protein
MAVAQVVHANRWRSVSPQLTPAAGQLFAEPSREAFRVLVAALQVAEDQRVITR